MGQILNGLVSLGDIRTSQIHWSVKCPFSKNFNLQLCQKIQSYVHLVIAFIKMGFIMMESFSRTLWSFRTHPPHLTTPTLVFSRGSCTTRGTFIPVSACGSLCRKYPSPCLLALLNRLVLVHWSAPSTEFSVRHISVLALNAWVTLTLPWDNQKPKGKDHFLPIFLSLWWLGECLFHGELPGNVLGIHERGSCYPLLCFSHNLGFFLLSVAW